MLRGHRAGCLDIREHLASQKGKLSTLWFRFVELPTLQLAEPEGENYPEGSLGSFFCQVLSDERWARDVSGILLSVAIGLFGVALPLDPNRRPESVDFPPTLHCRDLMIRFPHVLAYQRSRKIRPALAGSVC